MYIRTLYLLRHGETDSNKARILANKAKEGLNEQGRNQAMAVAECLKEVPLDIIYTSPQAKAIETARVISNTVNVRLGIRSELVERDYGPYEGMSREQLIEKRRTDGLCIDDPTQDWYGVTDVESDESVWRRVRPLLEASYNDKDILLVTHAGVVKSVLHSIFEIPHHKRNCFKIRNGTLIVLKNVHGQLELNELIPTTFLAPGVQELK